MSELASVFRSLDFGILDAIDITVVAFIIYSILTLIRGTRAMQMSVGLLVLAGFYFLAIALDLPVLHRLTKGILFYLPFGVIVLYQHEIRRALTSFGQNPLMSFSRRRTGRETVEEIARATFELAERKIGALIAIERGESLRVFAETGKAVDAPVTRELLLCIFSPGTPLHDGAVLIQGDRIGAAGAFLPLTTNPDSIAQHGTRHRAALGLSEETDAFVLCISEQTGLVSAASQGRLHADLGEDALADLFRIELGVRPELRG